jgi:hypothetical protein
MSGLDIVIYIAGLLLLVQLFIERLIKLVHLWRRLVTTARKPLPPVQQFEVLPGTRSKDLSGLAVRNNAE